MQEGTCPGDGKNGGRGVCTKEDFCKDFDGETG